MTGKPGSLLHTSPDHARSECTPGGKNSPGELCNVLRLLQCSPWQPPQRWSGGSVLQVCLEQGKMGFIFLEELLKASELREKIKWKVRYHLNQIWWLFKFASAIPKNPPQDHVWHISLQSSQRRQLNKINLNTPCFLAKHTYFCWVPTAYWILLGKVTKMYKKNKMGWCIKKPISSLVNSFELRWE